MRLLIAYDGSSFAKDIRADLRRAGLPPDTEAVVLSVADVWGPTAPPEAYEGAATARDKLIRARAEEHRRRVAAAVEQARAMAAEAVEGYRADYPGWSLRADARSGSPAWELIKHAEAWPADLIVVGSEGLTAWGRLLLGSVSQKVLTEAQCSVRIARQPEGASAAEAGAPARVLVAIDGSANAEAVVRAVAARSWPRGSAIHLLAVDDPFNRPAAGTAGDQGDGATSPDSETPEDWPDRAIDTARRILGAGGPTVTHAVRWGDARNVIVEDAADWRADSIFLGARGMGLSERLLLGSVSSAVASRAPCSVEVVRSRG